MEKPTIDQLVSSVRSAFNSTINLPEEILKFRSMRVDKSNGLFAREVAYGNVYMIGKEVSIRQAGNERSDNWDVRVSYMRPNSEDVVEVKSLIDIHEDEKALEILGDVLNKFFFRKEGEIFKARPIGYDLAGFVESREAGQRVVDMFKKAQTNVSPEKAQLYCFVDGGEPAWLDYRPHEPNWIQVKVGYCDKHKANIEKLYVLVWENGGIITQDIIKTAQNVISHTKQNDGRERK